MAEKDKMYFEEPKMEVIRFNALEIITTTSGMGDEYEVEQPTPEPLENDNPLL